MELIIDRTKFKSDNFVYKYIPLVLKQLILSEYKHKKDMPIFSYITKNYGLSMSDITAVILDSLIFKEYQGKTIIKINGDYKIKNIKLLQLLKLIDYGNLDVAGVKLFKSSESYIKNNLKELFAFYQALVGGKKNGD